MKKVLFFIFLFVGIVFLFVSNNTNKIKKPLDNIIYGTVPVTIDSLVHIAYKKEFFKENGLDVELQLNTDGKTSLDNLFNGKADIIAVTATPIIYTSFKRDDFVIIADIKHTDIHKGIVRKSSVKNVVDLKGKKIAVMKGTSAEFFMDGFLLFNNIKNEDLIVDKTMNAPEKLQAFLDNKIDGFFCWEPFISKAKKALKDEAYILPNKDVFVGSWLIVVKKEYLKNNKNKVKRFLKSLLKAEEIVKNNREEAIKIHSDVAGIDYYIAHNLFSKVPYTMKLDESLLNLLEDQAKWAIKYNYVKSKNIPNYLKLIDTNPLNSINKDAVTIIGYE